MTLRFRIFSFLALLCLTGLAVAELPQASVVRVRAVAADGEAKWGSAVVVGPGRLATTCHVIRSATTIEILHDDQRLPASSQAGSVTHDLCVLTVETLHLPPVAIRSSHELNIGERVTALGFEHGKPVLMTAAGAVRGLYGYDDGFVIRTSASFDFGSSGGGLFDESGRLIGILAFKARTGSDLHFALPADWLEKDNTVAARFESSDAVPPTLAFWEQSPMRRPTFLGTALREASESQR